MPDDKTPKAEQLIRQVADELKRMEDAVVLFNSAQEKIDAVLSSSKKIVQDIEKFSSACGSILTKLSETDLTRHLDELQTKNKEITAMVSKGGEDTTHAIATLESRIGDTQEKLLTMEKESRIRQFITMGFVVLTFFAASTSAILLLQPFAFD